MLVHETQVVQLYQKTEREPILMAPSTVLAGGAGPEQAYHLKSTSFLTTVSLPATARTK
jgi:hypothetical protein